METQAEKARYAREVFLRLSLSTKERLEHGLRLREKMGEQLARGEKPTGYRPEWLRLTALRIIRELHEAGKEFNEEHPDDLISTHDLYDVLASAIGMLKKASSR